MAALLRVSVETVLYGKDLYKKKKAKQRGTNHKVQSRRENGFSTASTIMNSLAFPLDVVDLIQNGRQPHTNTH
jgi:hypothetical protein